MRPMLEQKKMPGRHKDIRIVTRSGDLRRINPAKRCWGFPITDDEGRVIYPPPPPKLKVPKSRLNSMGVIREEARAFFRQFPFVSEGLADEVAEKEAKAAERGLMAYVDPSPPVKLGDLMEKKRK